MRVLFKHQGNGCSADAGIGSGYRQYINHKNPADLRELFCENLRELFII
jgi:hypothetical protein